MRVNVKSIFVGLLVMVWVTSATAALSSKEQLGKSIFFDENLSVNMNQSCASCHGPEAGWTGPLLSTNAGGAVYEGSILGNFGNRKPPSAAYATFSPIFHSDKKGLFIGGNFWDGRATGETLGSPAADQAQGPFLNPVEQALLSPADVVSVVCTSDYGDLFMEVWGSEACGYGNESMAYDYIALSIAAYEASEEVNAFSSKYDLTFKNSENKAKLSQQEQKGLALFWGKGKCAKCHSLGGKNALFTDFTFDNLGLPQNPENPAGTAPAFIDPGLGGFLMSAGYEEDIYLAEWGKHKVPTLRNVDLRPNQDFVKAYGHNGYFKSLKGIVHFYNTRDVKDECPSLYSEAEALAANCWPQPEISENVNKDELGDLGLTDEEEDAIVAFLKTLSDGHQP